VAYSEQTFRWTWDLQAPPEALWPLVSNTDRFNRDCGYPSVVVLPPAPDESSRITNARQLRAKVMGLRIEWTELAFEWIEPRRYAVERTYHSGPVARMKAACDLAPNVGGGTSLIYELRVTPANWLGWMIVPYSIGRKARAITERVFRRYDAFALQGRRLSALAQKPRFTSGGAERLSTICRGLIDETLQPAPVVGQLAEFIAMADDQAAARMRPYALAGQWGTERRETLQLFLHATRAGLLDFSWDLVCPHCRGAKVSTAALAGLKSEAHCDSCNIDFTANFAQSVELTFIPNSSIRPVVRADYCVGGPQITPHIVAQQRLAPGAQRTLPLALAPGRYRVRVPGLTAQQAFRVVPAAPACAQVTLGAGPSTEQEIAPAGALTIVNGDEAERLAIVEHVAWSDQSTTAAEVTSLQLFRDLFASEVLRPGEQISVGAMTVVFTDLKNSTQLYQEIGDAPAFGRVLTHFEILKAACAEENGAVVKTMGDAVMAVFPRPVSALRAMLHAQHWLARPNDYRLPPGVSVPTSSLQPLALKVGLHYGPCLAINQNERLDYFGTTVNIGARLCGRCTGSDLVLSDAIYRDPEVAAWLSDPDRKMVAEQESATLKGFGDAAFTVWRLRLHLGFSSPPF